MHHSACPHAHGSGSGIMAQLRSGTEAKHAEAEGHPFQVALVRGQLPRSSYAAYLHQLTHVHSALESGLRQSATSDPRATAIVERLQSRIPDLDADRAALGALGPEPPTEATRRFVERIESAAGSSPLSLLGMHYVLEGSKNGGRFIAKAVRRAYSLADDRGTRYLDPHGDAQRDHWLAFKALMDAQSFSPAESREIVDGAGEMFDAIARISQELLEAVPV